MTPMVLHFNSVLLQSYFISTCSVLLLHTFPLTSFYSVSNYLGFLLSPDFGKWCACGLRHVQAVVRAWRPGIRAWHIMLKI